MRNLDSDAISSEIIEFHIDVIEYLYVSERVSEMRNLDRDAISLEIIEFHIHLI